jgi:hypothetical protein
MEKKLRVIELCLDDEGAMSGVYANSFVTAPAIEKGFVFMNKQQNKPVLMTVEQGEKRLVYGPVMIPDLMIYRNDEKFGEYYATYTAETVLKCAHNYLKKNLQASTTIEHAFPIQGATMVESWIVQDGASDKANSFGYTDLPKGTWMAGYSVENDELWSMVKSGEITGFSIESWFDHKPIEMSEEDRFLSDLEKLLSGL